MTKRNRFVRPRRVLGSFLLTTATIVVFFAIVWHAWQRNVEDDSRIADVPVVRADTEPYKVKPDDEEGLDVPFQEFEVFEEINTQEQEPETKIVFLSEDDEKSESIDIEPDLPTIKADDVLSSEFSDLEETPEEKTVETYDLSSDKQQTNQTNAQQTQSKEQKTLTDNNVNAIEDVVDKVKTALETKETVQQESDSDQSVLNTGNNQPIVKNQDNQSDTTKTNTNELPTVESNLKQSGDYTIQLGAVRSLEDAKTEWKRITKKADGLLREFELRTETADLGSKGIFYRIQAGELSNDEAKKLCDNIKKTGASDCIIKKISR
jgi:cell division septation protein DedD